MLRGNGCERVRHARFSPWIGGSVSGTGSAVLLAEEEYDSLMETAHLLRSPENAARLFSALERAQRGEGEARTLTEVRAEFGRAEEE